MWLYIATNVVESYYSCSYVHPRLDYTSPPSSTTGEDFVGGLARKSQNPLQTCTPRPAYHESRATSHQIQISRITGRISGRLEVCLLMYRLRSTRIFSLMTPQSDFSSALDSSTVFMITTRAPAISSCPLSLINPRLTISGCDSIFPLCLSIAMICTTMPSSETCLRSRTTTP